MQINNRQSSILYELLRAEDFMPAEEIGSRLDLSGRVVRFNLTSIETWLKGRGGSLVVKPHEGICLDISQASRNQLLAMLSRPAEDFVSLRPKFRRLWIAFKLLTHVHPLNTYSFRSQLDVSENAFSHDCIEVKEILASYGVNLIRKQGVGTFLEASEINIRHALLAVLVDILGETTIVNLCLWQKVKLINPWSELGLLRSMTLQVVKTWEPWDAWRVTNHLLSMLGCECPEADHAQIALYLAIALMRSKSVRHVEMPAEQLNQIRSSRIFTMLEKMVRRIPYADTVHFPDEELAQLSFQIAAHLGVELLQEHEDTLETASEIGPIAVADQILRETHTVLGLEFGESSITPKLAEHLRRYLTRMRYGMYINNRFLEDVRKSYPEIFAAVRTVTFEMQNALGGPLPEDELAFITMYAAMAIQLHRSKQPTRKLRVVVVCPAGGITAAMLMFRLRSELPEIETVEVMSIKDLTRNTISNVDAIITTAHSLAHQDIPVIPVHPLLGPKDLIKIRAILNPSSFR